MRRIVSVVLCVCLLFTLFSAMGVSASAESQDKVKIPKGLFEDVKSAAEGFKSEVDIGRFDFDSDMEESLLEVLDQITDLPEMFYVSGEFKYTTEKLYLQYEYTKAQATEMMEDISSVAESITGDLIASNLSDELKAILIHDRLALLCEYDYENYLSKNIPFDSFTMYGSLVKGVAVCEGYAKAYQYMLDLVGIESYLCESEELRHMWNIVIIDGEEYHVDVTYDDPVYDTTGRVEHGNFLLSTEELLKTGDHTAYDYDSSPNNTKYDNYYWQSSKTAFQHINGKVYYFDNTKGKLKRVSDGKVLDTITDRWSAGDKGNWVGYYTRLSSDGENLYYSGNNAIYIYHPKTGFRHRVYAPKLPDNLQIYGFMYRQNEFIIEYNDSPNYDEKTQANNGIRLRFNLSENRFTGLVSDTEDIWHYVVEGVEQKKTGIYKIGDNYYYIEKGIFQAVTGFVSKGDNKYYYFKDGIWQGDYKGLVSCEGKWYYVESGIRKSATGLIKHTNGKYYYVKKGVWQSEYNGLVKYNNKWYYTANGIRQTNTGLVKHTNGKYYYVKRGIWQSGYKGLVKHNNKWYYAVKGIRQTNTGLIKHTNGKYYYVKRGIWQSGYRGLVKHNNKWYYTVKGIYQTNTGLVKHTNGKYYYVKKGIAQTKLTGFVKHTDGKYYYVKNGIWQSGYKGLVKYNGKYYYTIKGVRQYATQFVKHTNGKIYYVKKGITQTNFTGFVKDTNGKIYYVKKGIFQNKVTGTVKINGMRYYIKNGIYYSA